MGRQNGVKDGAVIHSVWGRGRYGGGRKVGQKRGRDIRQLLTVAPSGSSSRQSSVAKDINNPPGYKILLLNARLVTGKTAATQDLILDERAELSCITETWLGKGSCLQSSYIRT